MALKETFWSTTRVRWYSSLINSSLLKMQSFRLGLFLLDLALKKACSLKWLLLFWFLLRHLWLTNCSNFDSMLLLVSKSTLKPLSFSSRINIMIRTMLRFLKHDWPCREAKSWLEKNSTSTRRNIYNYYERLSGTVDDLERVHCFFKRQKEG